MSKTGNLLAAMQRSEPEGLFLGPEGNLTVVLAGRFGCCPGSEMAFQFI